MKLILNWFWQAMNGFLMMMTQNGKLLYISDNAAEYLGHSMVNSHFDFDLINFDADYEVDFDFDLINFDSILVFNLNSTLMQTLM